MEATNIVLWRGPSPGVRGWLLRRTGGLFAPYSSKFLPHRPKWVSQCPRCGNADARLFGPDLLDRLGLGNLACEACAAAYGFKNRWEQLEKFMPDDYDAEVDTRLAAAAGFTSVAAAQQVALAELEQALPEIIDLSWDRDTIIAKAMRAVRRYGGQHGEIHPVILEVACWQKHHRVVKKLPAWIATEVQTALRRELALEMLGKAFGRITAHTGELVVHTHELVEHEPDVVEALGELLDRRTEDPIVLGKLLGSFELKVGESPPGLRKLRRTGVGHPWMFVAAPAVPPSGKKR